MKKVEFTEEQVVKYLDNVNRHGESYMVLLKFDEDAKECSLYAVTFSSARAEYLRKFCKYFEVFYVIHSSDKLFTISVYPRV